jgi:polyisoprenoid-binding protein YceI
MKRFSIKHVVPALVMAAGIFSQPASAQTYAFDATHTKIIFAYNHLGMSNQYGRFDGFDGEVAFSADKMAEAKVNVTIDANSIDTDVAKLDEHLKSPDFFDTAKYPKITFKSTGAKQTGSKSLQISGDLTIKGKTLPVVLDATLNYQGEHPLAKFIKAYAGSQWLAFSARTRVRRSDFDLGLYAPMTSDTVDIIIETELREKK